MSRPLIALLVLLAALAIGYAVRAGSSSGPSHPAPTHSSSSTGQHGSPSAPAMR